jgi:hypothetical protein
MQSENGKVFREKEDTRIPTRQDTGDGPSPPPFLPHQYPFRFTLDDHDGELKFREVALLDPLERAGFSDPLREYILDKPLMSIDPARMLADKRLKGCQCTEAIAEVIHDLQQIYRPENTPS